MSDLFEEGYEDGLSDYSEGRTWNPQSDHPTYLDGYEEGWKQVINDERRKR